jgi:hypothetical protein
VLEFYNGSLYQIGFSKTTAIADRTTFNAVVKRVSDTYGKPRQLKADDPDKLLWRVKYGNMIMVEYSYIDDRFVTFLILIDGETSIKIAKK